MTRPITLLCTVATAAIFCSTAAFAQEMPSSVGITVATLGNPFFQPLIAGARDTIEERLPEADITVLGADYDLNKQTSQINNFIASDVGLMILNSVDAVAIEPAVMRAKEAGMTVAAVDVSAAGADLTVMTNNTQAGRITCEFLAEQIGGEGSFVIIDGPPVSSIIDRATGCKEALEAYPDIEVLSDNQNGQASRDGGFQVMQGLLTRFPEIDAVFGVNDPTAIGAQLAAQQLDRDEMIIGGVDGSPDFVEALQQEGSLLVASASQDPYAMSQRATEMALELIGGTEPEEPTVLLDTELVTQENAASWAGWDAER